MEVSSSPVFRPLPHEAQGIKGLVIEGMSLHGWFERLHEGKSIVIGNTCNLTLFILTKHTLDHAMQTLNHLV